MEMSFKGKYNIGRKNGFALKKIRKCVLNEFLYYSKDKIQYL